jgi:23S rRNA pseudouridine2605 synthase
MTDDTPEPPPEPVPPPEAGPDPAPTSAPRAGAKTGDRIAKVLARAGISSRRDAEKLIEAGRVAVNGRIIDSPALDIEPRDRVTVDGQPIPEAEPPRLWLYHKPAGLVTTEKDEEGRPTVFDNLPEGLPRVMSVGRLDITSEGLLLLTNDGEIKRRLELPATGWLRKYRVRVNGTPDDASLEPLRQGLTVDGTAYQPMQVVLDRQQGANAWLTVGLREGKNREVRRAMEAVGLTVNRLIRVSYGPFRLEELEPGQVEEVRPRVLRDQLGLEETPGAAARTGRTMRALKPVAGSAADRPAKPGFAARTGKAGWLADPSASGRPRAGTKGPGKARPIDDKGPDDAPRPRKPAGFAGKPRAAGTRSAAAEAKGPARARPAWGAGPRDTPEDADAPRTRKPRASRTGAGAGAPSREDRAPRTAAGPAGGKPAGRAFGKAPGKPWAKPAGDRPPRAARADTGDTDARATARPARVRDRTDERSDDRPSFPRSRGPGAGFGKGPGTGTRTGSGTGKPRPRSDGDSPDRGPRPGPKTSPRSWGTKSASAPGARGPRRDDSGGDAPRPPRAPRAGAPDKGTTDRPRSSGTSYKGDGPRAGKGAPAPRGDRSGPDGPGATRSGGKPGGKPGGPRPAGGGLTGRVFKDRAGAGPRDGGPSGGGAGRSGPKPGGPGRSGPRPGGAKPGGPKGGGPGRDGPKGGGSSGGGPRGGRPGG